MDFMDPSLCLGHDFVFVLVILIFACQITGYANKCHHFPVSLLLLALIEL